MMRRVEFVIAIVDSDLYYNGSNPGNQDITLEHFSEINVAFTFDSYEEAELSIMNIDIYEPLSIVKIYNKGRL
jgi:GH25 family lysozyme M1 (1,4-beta-N-acetylmuramidase)